MPAAIILTSLLSQSYAPAVQALAVAAKPDGSVDPTTFAITSAALRTPEATKPSERGGLGASAVAILDLGKGRALATAGTLAVNPGSSDGAAMLASAAAVAAADASHVAFVGLLHRGGSVKIISAPGEGTRVSVRLPRTDDALELPQPAALPAAPPTGSATVLLVEDEEGVRRANKRILTEAGFTVVVASTGPEALELFAVHEVDTVVSDVVMPGGLSGPELVEQLRLQRPGLPAVLVSGHSRDHLMRRGSLPLGVQLLRKPFAAQTLVDATRRSLEAEAARS